MLHLKILAVISGLLWPSAFCTVPKSTRALRRMVACECPREPGFALGSATVIVAASARGGAFLVAVTAD